MFIVGFEKQLLMRQRMYANSQAHRTVTYTMIVYARGVSEMEIKPPVVV